MTEKLLRRVSASALLPRARQLVDAQTLQEAAQIVEDVRSRGEAAVREHAERLGDITAGQALVVGREQLHEALRSLPDEQQDVLRRTAERIGAFADAQLNCIEPLTMTFSGGRAGHTVRAVERAGCYAPGGRYPLPSSVLMTAVTAKTAGVPSVWIASPRPATVTLAAAALAEAEALVAVGGAQAIAALAYGAGPIPACDVVVGPGNRWVTAAKKLVAGDVGIDLLAGPSELVVLADETADAALVAADLLAQAEHDPQALPVLVTWSPELAEQVDEQLDKQLVDLPTAATARASLGNGFTVLAADLSEALAVINALAPEHVEVMVAELAAAQARLGCYGSLFLGSSSAQVFGDYGAGPNHVLPTGGTGRFTGGLSALHFLAVRTWLRLDDARHPQSLAHDAVHLARLEGLEAHARALERRIWRKD